MKRSVLCTTLAVLLVAAVAYADVSANQLFTQIEQEYGLPQGILTKIAKVESNGNPTAGSPDRAYGMFQWLPRSWYDATVKLYGRYVDLNERTNVSVSAKVTAFSLKQAQNQNGAIIQQAKLDMTLGLYMCHFLGNNGCAKFFQAYIQNPNADATSLFPREAANNGPVFRGRTLNGVLNYFAQRLQVSGTLNIAGNFSDRNNISYAYSDADLSTSSFMAQGFVPTVRDNAYTYPPTYNSVPQTLIPPTQISQPQLTSSVAQPTTVGAATGTTSTQQPVVQQIPPLSTSTAPTPNPAAIIIAQPQTVPQGNPIQVAWSTVGMKDGSCKVFQGTFVIAQVNQGASIVSTKSLSGTLTFMLQCVTQAGDLLSRTTSATIR